MNKELKKVLQDRGVNLRNIILMSYVGSQSHGTYIPKEDWENSIDDKDVMGVMLQDEDYYIGMKNKEQIEIKEGVWDIIIYDFKKFLHLLIKNNPNVLGMLYMEDKMIIQKNHIGDELIGMREKILSKKCYHAFSGYAHSQLRRIKNNACEGYMGDKRRALVERYGYDVKNASHLIRLLKMGMEALVEHKINVFREDAQTLIDIKKGLWTLKEVQAESKKLFELIEKSYIESTLQNEPQKDEVEKFQVKILKQHLS